MRSIVIFFLPSKLRSSCQLLVIEEGVSEEEDRELGSEVGCCDCYKKQPVVMTTLKQQHQQP